MKSLSWAQVNAWRVSQHYLSRRVPSGDLVQAVSRTMGVQAQVMSAAELSIGARVDGLSPQSVQDALWQQHSLVKTWAMRQTVHLLPAADLPLYVAARRITEINWPGLFKRFGVSREIYDAYLEVSPEILSDQPLTRQQFAEAVGDRLKSPQLGNYLANRAWGSPLKPLAWRGDLCFGPNAGQNVTFVRPSAWLNAWQALEPEVAMQEVVRRYLTAYGPARPENFQLWWGHYIGPARQAFHSIANELEEVVVEGWQAFALRSTTAAMQDSQPNGTVRLLPMFDAYTIGLTRGKHIPSFLSLLEQKKVYRSQGWISAVVLVDGIIKGTWEYKEQKAKTLVTVNLFSALTDQARQAIEAEGECLGKYLNTRVSVEFLQE